MFERNSAIQPILCSVGRGLTSSGASAGSIHFSPFSTVPHWVQVSAFEAESCPPLAKLVSMAA